MGAEHCFEAGKSRFSWTNPVAPAPVQLQLLQWLPEISTNFTQNYSDNTSAGFDLSTQIQAFHKIASFFISLILYKRGNAVLSFLWMSLHEVPHDPESLHLPLNSSFENIGVSLIYTYSYIHNTYMFEIDHIIILKIDDEKSWTSPPSK